MGYRDICVFCTHARMRTDICGTYCVAKSTLAATSPVTTALYVADENTIVEMVPQIPGQMAVDGAEQDAPPMLKLVKTAM